MGLARREQRLWHILEPSLRAGDGVTPLGTVVEQALTPLRARVRGEIRRLEGLIRSTRLSYRLLLPTRMKWLHKVESWGVTKNMPSSVRPPSADFPLNRLPAAPLPVKAPSPDEP